MNVSTISPVDRLSCVLSAFKMLQYAIYRWWGRNPPKSQNNNQLQSISETTCHKHWARMLKNGAQRWIRFSKYVTPVYKMKEVILYCFVVRNNLSQFLEIHFQFLDICISKTYVKQGNSEIQKLGLRDGFDCPNMWHL